MVVAVTRDRKKVLFVVNEAYFFLSHRQDLGRAMLDRGYETHVAAPEDHAWAPNGFDVSELEKHGFFFHPIRLSRRGHNPLAELRTLLDIWRVIGLVRPDAVHLLTIKPIIYGGVAARARMVGLIILGFTGLGEVFAPSSALSRLRRKIVAATVRSCLRRPGMVAIVQNSEDQAIVAELSCRASRPPVLIRGSGVDIRQFGPAKIPDGRPLVLFAGRLMWEKGVGDFVEIARKLKERGVDARFVIVGRTVPNNPSSLTRSQMEKWAGQGDIEWWGYQSDMASVLSQCSVFCYPSKYREGVPKVLLEAAAVERPLVVSDINGCREVVKNGVQGLLCAPGDISAFADAIESLVEDREECERMGREGRKKIVEEFDVKIVVRSTMNIYDEYFSERTAKQ